MRVEIVLAFRERQYVQSHHMPIGASVADLMRESRILENASRIEPDKLTLAVRGREVNPQTLLREGDRVEILRPLTIDPRQARRRRANLKSGAG